MLSLPYLRSANDFDAVMAGEANALQNTPADARFADDVQLALADDATSAMPTADTGTATNETRVAMLPAAAAEPRALATAPAQRSPAVVASAQSLIAENSSTAVEDAVPIPRAPVPAQPAPVIPAFTHYPTQAAVAPEEAAAEEEIRTAERDALDAEMNVALTRKPVQKTTAHFDSTGHLAMSGPQGGALAGTRPPPTPAPAPEQRVKKEPRRRSRPADQQPAPPQQSTPDMTAMATSGGGDLWAESGDDAFGTNAEVPLEDVILQQPLENRRVDRVENVIAVTRAKGFPIALVRSDLPDDFWWVQQMVGIRGNAFAARANFGNESSLPGSVYHMVIVFLDSADEAHRFRIAKRFKDLPEGSRHSREFTFVRQ